MIASVSMVLFFEGIVGSRLVAMVVAFAERKLGLPRQAKSILPMAHDRTIYFSHMPSRRLDGHSPRGKVQRRRKRTC
ncbi:hypothetical protein B0O80DRAFT_472675 [Mortierella sp. GBAus27b]|nr:hypothetical protein B0O80DRAFT_472675 [Mortierella sp. GBAus27b]